MHSKQFNNIIIATTWIIIFLWPLGVAVYRNMAQDEPFDAYDLQRTYLYLSAFWLLFLVHNYVVLPYIYPRKHLWLSLLVFFSLMAGFCTFLKYVEPDRKFPTERHHKAEHLQPFVQHPNHPFTTDEQMPHPMRKKFHSREEDRPHQRLFFLSPPDTARMLIALLMLGANLGIFAMFKANEQKKRLLQLEQQNLKQELDNLKHQINPHFFMNTLNNIHALIDIDQELAKRSLIELSQMMRYMLYDGTGTTVSLNREIEYIERYISLMKLRYSDKVEIICQIEQGHDQLQIPPLLLVTFVENAFKHGVSYREQSYIYVHLDVIDNGRVLYFGCTNSRHDVNNAKSHVGIGLENVRKRLNLIYGDTYRLEVDSEDAAQYTVNLFLPTTQPTNTYL